MTTDNFGGEAVFEERVGKDDDDDEVWPVVQ